MIRKLALCAALLCVSLLPAIAVAGPYFGASGLVAERSYENVDTSIGGKVSLGYHFETAPVILQVSYFNTGDAEITDYYNEKLRFTGVEASAGYFWRLSRRTGSGLWLKGGIYNGEADDPVYYDEIISSTGPLVGFGGVWKATPWFGIRGEIEALTNVDEGSDDGKGAIVLASVGLVFEIPTGGHTSRPAPPRLPPPTYAPPPSNYPAAMVPVAPAAAPPPPAPTQSAHGGRIPAYSRGKWLLAEPADIRIQPSGLAAVQKSAPAGAVISAEANLANAEGGWWFVRYQDASGWLQESTLGNASRR